MEACLPLRKVVRKKRVNFEKKEEMKKKISATEKDKKSVYSCSRSLEKFKHRETKKKNIC